MKVGILGSGDVAKALAGGFLKHGHDVMMGTRTPVKLSEWGRHFNGSKAEDSRRDGRGRLAACTETGRACHGFP